MLLNAAVGMCGSIQTGDPGFSGCTLPLITWSCSMWIILKRCSCGAVLLARHVPHLVDDLLHAHSRACPVPFVGLT